MAGDGELPFRVGAGFPAPVIDARFGNIFATIEVISWPMASEVDVGFCVEIMRFLVCVSPNRKKTHDFR